MSTRDISRLSTGPRRNVRVAIGVRTATSASKAVGDDSKNGSTDTTENIAESFSGIPAIVSDTAYDNYSIRLAEQRERVGDCCNRWSVDNYEIVGCFYSTEQRFHRPALNQLGGVWGQCGARD